MRSYMLLSFLFVLFISNVLCLPISFVEPLVTAAEETLQRAPTVVKPKAFTPILESIAERPESSVVRERLLDAPGLLCTQGQVRACHIYATKNLFKDQTGVELSQSRMFLNHLLNPSTEVAANPELAVDHNLQFIKSQKQLLSDPRAPVTADFDNWERGKLVKNLKLLKSSGGVVAAPENELKDWKSIEATIQRITAERERQITRVWKLSDAQAKQRLQKAGFTDLIDKALSPVDATGRNIEGDRFAVMEIAKGLEAVPVRLAFERQDMEAVTLDRVTQLVNTLEEHAAYLSVDTKHYWKVLDGQHLPPSPLGFPTRGGHAITLAGYDHAENKFLVLDSNSADLLRIDPYDLVQTISRAYTLKKV